MLNEENTVEQMVLDTLCGGVPSNMVTAALAVSECCISGNRSTGGILHGI